MNMSSSRSSRLMPHSHAWPLRVGLVLALVALIAAACATASNASTPSGAGGTLTVAVPGAPTGLDPATGTAQTRYTDVWAYDPLIYQTPKGAFKPGLALSWKYGPGNKSFSMTLRPGVRFSDGTPFNAKALKTWLEYENSVAGSVSQTYFKLSKIVVSGPLSLTLHFKEPAPLLPLVFSQLNTAGMPASPKAIANKSLATSTDGTGEYMLDSSQTVAGDHYTFVPNPHYWNKKAVHWKQVVVKVITNPDSVVQAMATGQVQVAMDAPISSVPTAARSGMKAVTPLTLMMTLVLADRDGTISKPLADVRVRQALNYAVDRVSMAKALGAGFGQPIDQMAIPGDDSYSKALKATYPYDPAKAKSLLAAAGYPKGFSFSAVATPVVGLDTFGEALVGQLAKVGVTLNLDIKDPGSYYAGVTGQQYSAFTVSWGRLPAPIQYGILWGPARTFGNPFASSSTEITKLYNQMLTAPDAQESVLAQQTQKILVQQAWFLPVFANPLAVIYSPKVAGMWVSGKRSEVYGPEFRPTS